MNLKSCMSQSTADLKITTLGILRREGELSLGMKKKGFGAGNWNFPGGKKLADESPEECLVREIAEEYDISVSALSLVAILYFYFSDKPEWNQKCYVYETEQWQGEPTESEEMAPRWWSNNGIPYHEMWPADEDWLEPVLRGQILTGYFLFDSSQNCLELSVVLGKIEER